MIFCQKRIKAFDNGFLNIFHDNSYLLLLELHLSTTSYKTRIILIILCHETNFASITFAMEYCNFLVASGCEYVVDITCVLQFRPNSTINRAVTYILEAPKVMKWHSNFLSFSSIICVRIIRLQRYIESLFVSNSNVMHELIPWPKISIITRKLSTQQAQCHTNTSIRQKRLSEIRLYKFYNRENLKPNCLRIQCASNVTTPFLWEMFVVKCNGKSFKSIIK